MGVCMGKAANKENAAVERERRRLSVNKADAIEEKQQTEPKGKESKVNKASILDLFPKAQKKFSICGVASEEQQKEFADKETVGDSEGIGNLRIGCSCKKGLKPESPNQDDFCVFRVDGTGIYAVFDGHGPYGHDISSFVQEQLPRAFVSDKTFVDDPEKALNAAFLRAHTLCTESQAEFDCALSGTTATVVMQRDNTLYVAHVGDSRAVLARHKGKELLSEELTADHKPCCPVERKRIEAAGGQVRRLEGDIPHRVFVKGKLYPGLAMTRSIGDTVGTTAGVSCIPEVKKFKVVKDCAFLLICSDGIWEFIHSQEAVNIVGRYGPADVQKAADNLASEAWNRWIAEEGNIVDDITVIIAWFQ